MLDKQVETPVDPARLSRLPSQEHQRGSISGTNLGHWMNDVKVRELILWVENAIFRPIQDSNFAASLAIWLRGNHFLTFQQGRLIRARWGKRDPLTYPDPCPEIEEIYYAVMAMPQEPRLGLAFVKFKDGRSFLRIDRQRFSHFDPITGGVYVDDDPINPALESEALHHDFLLSIAFDLRVFGTVPKTNLDLDGFPGFKELWGATQGMADDIGYLRRAGLAEILAKASTGKTQADIAKTLKSMSKHLDIMFYRQAASLGYFDSDDVLDEDSPEPPIDPETGKA